MKKILITAYAVNPYKGSEDGTGWNIIWQLAKYNKVVAVTRKNNREAIENYTSEHPFAHQENLSFAYYDLPYWMRFWKRKSRGALLYFYLWQFFMPLFIKLKGIKFDLAHGLNFHADWAPCFLWILGKPFVWGPVGHHPKIPANYLEKNGGFLVYLKDRLKWGVKLAATHFDPFLRMTVYKADYIMAINSGAGKILRLKKKAWEVIPAVGANPPPSQEKGRSKGLRVLSVGRFVPLKGFDLTLLAFAQYFQSLGVEEKKNTSLTLIGKGPEREKLERLIKEHELEGFVKIINWLPQSEIFEAYRKADIFLFPSHEGAGMVIPEALSYHLPVICLDNIGPGELMDKHSGIKIPYTTYEKTLSHLANALHKLSRDSSVLKQYSLGAKNRFETHLTWDIKGEKINQIYKEVLDKNVYQ